MVLCPLPAVKLASTSSYLESILAELLIFFCFVLVYSTIPDHDGHQQNGTIDVGCSPVNPLGALINECALTPAKCLLNYRQARFAQTVLSASEGSDTENILRWRWAVLTERLRTATRLGEGDDDVEVGHGEGKKFQGAVVIMEGKDPKEAEQMAKAAALEWTERRTRPGRTDLGWRIKMWGAQWCGRKKRGTAEHHKPSKKDRGSDGKRTEDGGRHPTTHTKVAEERAGHGTRA